MRNYELTVLLKTGPAESELQELLGEIASLLQNEGALIVSQESKGKRFLKTPVKKQQEAELAVLKFTLDPAKLEGTTKNLKAKELTRAKTMAPPANQEEQEEQRVELGDIDKKLEEIFKDENL